jgi:hypothetical protein
VHHEGAYNRESDALFLKGICVSQRSPQTPCRETASS